MSSYIVLFNSAMITAFIYLSNICYANGVDFGSLERVPESYQENGEDASLKKDVFLNSQLFAETLTFIDPVSFLTASLVCRDWRGICKNAQLMEWYISKSFQKIHTQLNSPESLSEKFARLFVEIEVAKIIEHHRPKFPYTENVQIETSDLIRISSQFNGTRVNMVQRAPQQQAPLGLGFNFPISQQMTLTNLIPHMSLDNQIPQGNQVQRESYLVNFETQIERILSELNPRGSILGTVGAALAIVGDLGFDDDGEIDDADAIINNNFAVEQNQDHANERNLNQAQNNFRSFCDRTIPVKMRVLSDENFGLLASNRNMHTIIFQTLVDEIRNSNEFRAYVEQKMISYRSIYRTIDEIDPANNLRTLASIQLPDEESEDQYLIMLKQVFNKIVIGD